MTISLQDTTLLRQQCYVDGTWIDADARGATEVTNPATGDVIGTVPSLGAAETRRAIKAAAATAARQSFISLNMPRISHPFVSRRLPGP